VKPAVFLAEAETVFAEAAIICESQSPGLGNDFIAEVERSVDEISRHPELGASYFEDTRRIFVRRFPFRVVYQERTERILIFAVAHQRRKPGYWRDRNKESPGESFDARRGRFAFGSAPVIGYGLLANTKTKNRERSDPDSVVEKNEWRMRGRINRTRHNPQISTSKKAGKPSPDPPR